MSSGRKCRSKIFWQMPRIPKYTYWEDFRGVEDKYIVAHRPYSSRQLKTWVEKMISCTKDYKKKEVKILENTKRKADRKLYYSFRMKDLKDK